MMTKILTLIMYIYKKNNKGTDAQKYQDVEQTVPDPVAILGLR